MTKYPTTKSGVQAHRLRHAALLFGVAALLMLHTQTAVGQSLAPNYWQQRMFFVPYQVNRQNPAFQRVAKVELLISRDGASDWRVLEDATPNVQGFSFLAPEDGEYWFALRHLDGNGQPWPAATIQPQMRVVVDTVRPVLELNGKVDGAGALVVRYDALDANLRPESLTIEVQSGDGRWSPLAIGPPDRDRLDRIEGHASWAPPAGARSVEIRAAILDKAGHRGEATTTVSLYLSSPSRSELPADMAAQPQILPPVATTQDWPADNRLPSMPIALEEELGSASAPPATNAYTNQLAPRDSSRTPALLVGERPGQLAATADAPDLPAPTRSDIGDTGVRLINSTTFDVDYELEPAGPWGAAKVELWGTSDNGGNWARFAVDRDNCSPVRVTVPRAGRYGFRIVVDSSSPPANGERPELIVDIDVTPPRIETFSAELGTNDHAGEVLFRWSVRDENLAPQSIGLYYSSFPSGPWTSIASVENAEGYSWQPDRHVPDRFYLKLDVRDAAGNLSATQLTTPIRLERPRATGKIQGVRAVSPEALREAPANKTL